MTRVATIRQCAVLVGGLATRLGALAAVTPKPLLPVGGRPFLAWLLRELSRFGVDEALLLAGDRGDQLRAALPELQRHLPRSLRLAVLDEALPAGTGGALVQARGRLDEHFLLCNGDSWLDANLAALLAAAAADSPEVLARLWLRQTDDPGRYGVATLDGDRIAAFAERPEPDAPPGAVNAGVAVLARAALDGLDPVCSLEGNLWPALARAGVLRGTVVAGWFVDIGVPADLARAQAELPAQLLRRPALLLDRDGVLNLDHGYVGSRERFDWVPRAPAAVRLASERGWHVFVVTNQSGVARGFYDIAAVEALHRWMADALRAAGGTVDDWRVCPFHPEASVPAYRRVSDWRKPAPGMALDLMRRWQLDPARCVLVGDQASDLAAAAAAGIAGRLFDGGDFLALVDRLTGDVATAGAPSGLETKET